MKNLTLLVLCCCSSLLLYGQDTNEVEINGQTFKVKKIVIKKAIDSTSTTVAAPAEKTVSKSIRVDKKGKDRTSPFEEAAVLPTFARGEYSLMEVKTYSPKMQLDGQKYVVLEYIINKYGWAQNIKVHSTNDKRLISVVLKKLRTTQWNPAKNQKGEAINYLAKKQVVIVKDRTYDEDYYDNY